MDPVAVGFAVILGVELVVIGILLSYLLYRPDDEKNKFVLKPETKVTTEYEVPSKKNGHHCSVKENPKEISSDSSSTLSDLKQNLQLSSISFEAEEPSLHHEPVSTIIEIFVENEGQRHSPVESTFTPLLASNYKTEKMRQPKDSGNVDDERNRVTEPGVYAVNVPSDEEGHHDPSRFLSRHDKQLKNKENNKKQVIEEPGIEVVLQDDIEEQGNQLSFSSASSDNDINVVYTQTSTPIKRTTLITKSVEEESLTSDSDSSDDSTANSATSKAKNRKIKQFTETSSSSSDEEIINHKKKTRRKRYVHNIEELEIIEEHTFNKTRKTVYKNSPVRQEDFKTSSDSEGENSFPMYSNQKNVRIHSKDKSSTSSNLLSSESSDEKMTSSNKDMTYYATCHVDVTNSSDDELFKTTSFMESISLPTKTNTYNETTEKNKEKHLAMLLCGSVTPENNKDAKMKSESKISIVSPPHYMPFTKTFALDKTNKDNKKSSSSSSSSSTSSSSSEYEDDVAMKKMRSETNINLKLQTSSSSSGCGDDDDIAKMSNSTQIHLQSLPKREIFTATFATENMETRSINATEVPSSKRKSSSFLTSSDENEGTNCSLQQPTQTSTVLKNFEKRIEVDDGDSQVKVSKNHVNFDRPIIVDGNDTRSFVTNEKLDLNRTTTFDRKMFTITKDKRISRKDFQFMSGWQRKVSLDDLLKAEIIEEETIRHLEEGIISPSEVQKSIHIYLQGEEPIAGLIVSNTREKISIYDAWKRGIIRRGTSISLLEAQAATGRIINPESTERMSVAEASQKQLIDRQFETVLARAERAVYGYKAASGNKTISVFEAMKTGVVMENHGMRMLEAQIATGGIIDPNANHRLPLNVAYNRRLLDKKATERVDDPADDTRGFFDPNTEENLTYRELMERCVIDEDTGLRLLPLKTTTKKPATKISKVVFESATHREVLLQDIVDAELVDLKTAKKFDEGQMTTEEVKNMVAQLKVFVDGTLPIAGVINSSRGEKMSIVAACRSGLIHKGTAFELLEAQAACGKLMDVQSGRPISIETALQTGVIDSGFADVVTRAGRAVTGYQEPFKREILSLCEALARHLVVERHAIRLLEAQIATGGIIDMKSPVRIKVEIALKRGLIDQKLADKLEKRETASYFDPVTGENLNYSELMGRCVLDKDTNLLFLMVEGGTVTQNVRPFEPEPESMKIRKKRQARLTTEVVQTTTRKTDGMMMETGTTSSPHLAPSSPPAVLSRRVVIVDPNSGNELTVKEALENKLIDKNTANQLLAQEGNYEHEENL